jgi:hypothetical protein
MVHSDHRCFCSCKGVIHEKKQLYERLESHHELKNHIEVMLDTDEDINGTVLLEKVVTDLGASFLFIFRELIMLIFINNI